MKISPDGSSFSTSGDVDSMSERSSQDNNGCAGVQRAPSQELSSFQELSDDRTGKEAELARCVVDLAQANERLVAANERLTAQVYNLSLQVVDRHGTADASSNETIVSLTTKQAKNLQDPLQMMTSDEREELKRSTIIMGQEKSKLCMGLSNLKKECAQLLESEFSEVKKDYESSIADLKEEVAPRATDGSLVQPWKQYIWESSRDACFSCIRRLKLLECPPVTRGVHKKWIIFVAFCLFLGVVSTVHSFEMKGFLEKGGWVYRRIRRQLASGECEELNRCVITLEQEKSELLVNLLNLQKECTELKSKLYNAKEDCDSSIAALQGPMMQPVKQYVWESSRDMSVDGPRDVELLKCPPMTLGIHKWSILVEEGERGYYGIASTAHRFENERDLGSQE